MGNVGDVGQVGPIVADPNLSIEELRKQGFSDGDIAAAKGVPIDAIKLNSQLPANAQFGGVTELPGVTGAPGQPRSPVLQAIDANPALAGLDEATKQSIANNPNSPLNPLNPNFTLGNTSDFGRQAQTEQVLQEALAKQQADQIREFGQQYQTDAEAKRQQLADRLAGQATDLESQYQTGLSDYEQALAGSRQKTFEQANPFILEDLNRRGLFNSETAVAQAQAEALAGLQAGDEGRLGEARLGALQDLQNFRQQGDTTLNQFEQGAFGQGQDIAGEALNTITGGNQNALDSALGLRRSELENKYNLAQSAADRQYASELARQQRKGSTGRILASAGKQS